MSDAGASLASPTLELVPALAFGLAALPALATVFALGASRRFAAQAVSRTVPSPTALPAEGHPDLVVVLGCPTHTRAGHPSRFLAGRAVAGAAAYHALGEPPVLCSGRGGADSDDESAALAALLGAQRVPLAKIALDRGARRTLDTLDYLAEHHPHERILLVTQAFHLPRVLFLARSRRLDAWGLVAPGPAPGWRARRREELGQLRALWDVALGRRG